MSDTISATIETKKAILKPEDIIAYWNPDVPKDSEWGKEVPQFWVFCFQDGSIYRIEESRKDLDIIPAFKQRISRQENSLSSSHEIADKELREASTNLRKLIENCRRQTMVILNPQLEGELVYDNFFIIRLQKHI